MAGDFNVSLDGNDEVAKLISDFAVDCSMSRCVSGPSWSVRDQQDSEHAA